jgi:hypothetical protein
MTKARDNANNWAADITGVTAGTGITGGGTSGAVTVTNELVTTIDAAGDLLYGTGSDAATRLAIGTAAQVLAVNSGATAPEWVTPAGGGFVVVQPETAFSAVANVTADGIFTSAYTNYRIVLRYTSTSGLIGMQFRVATVDTTTNYNSQGFVANSTTLTGARITSQSSGQIANNSDGSFFSLSVVDITGVQLAEPTVYLAHNTRNDGAYTTPMIAQYFGNQSASTAFDGIKILTTTGTMTGTYTIYGYRKTV